MWVLFITISSIFFVVGQTILKLVPTDAIDAGIVFMMSAGIFAFTYALCFRRNVFSSMETKSVMWLAVVGLTFFIGNTLWIKAIKNATNIGLVRMLMAGVEIALLLLVALILFKKQISLKTILLTITGCGMLIYASIL